MAKIKGRKELNVLLTEFYSIIRYDEVLGPIFTNHIADDEWEAHVDKITDFWESILFQTGSFKGNPMLAHVKVNLKENNSVKFSHFERWLSIWEETNNRMFKDCEVSKRAVMNSKNMARGLFGAIDSNRDLKLSDL